MTTPTETAAAPTTVPEPAPAVAATDAVAELAAIVSDLRAQVAALSASPVLTPAPVPTTDQSKPTITPVTLDLSTLPALARMAAGYKARI